jgi:hypothetical protein
LAVGSPWPNGYGRLVSCDERDTNPLELIQGLQGLDYFSAFSLSNMRTALSFEGSIFRDFLKYKIAFS